VVGKVGPQERSKAFLPTSTWRQFYLQTGCGGFCGAVRIMAPQATGCVPLTSGQFVVASDNEGHFGTATVVPARLRRRSPAPRVLRPSVRASARGLHEEADQDLLRDVTVPLVL
jgi:tannase/feruloyl esterase